ncbi:MAG: hypothetical protein JWL87_743 [Candidatus Adlerbacteria bacterium]|nr:hypothetical protein [Candidatus Adlerbacteria bacterium]
MKALKVLLLAASFSLLSLATSQAQVIRIADDNGGLIGPYAEKYRALAHTGQQVIIDGPCLSACTLVTGLIPRDRICVTRRAKLGFHAAWRPDQDGHAVHSKAGTQILMDTYPQNIRRWITRRGGLTPKMMYLEGRQLAQMYHACPTLEQRTASR